MITAREPRVRVYYLNVFRAIFPLGSNFVFLDDSTDETLMYVEFDFARVRRRFEVVSHYDEDYIEMADSRWPTVTVRIPNYWPFDNSVPVFHDGNE